MGWYSKLSMLLLEILLQGILLLEIWWTWGEEVERGLETGLCSGIMPQVVEIRDNLVTEWVEVSTALLTLTNENLLVFCNLVDGWEEF